MIITVRSLETVHRLSLIFDFVMYYIYGQSGPSLLIESTDSMIGSGTFGSILYSLLFNSHKGLHVTLIRDPATGRARAAWLALRAFQ